MLADFYRFINSFTVNSDIMLVEWQRLALKGEKINAIKAYRDIGGKYEGPYGMTWAIGLKEAKDAVEAWLYNNGL